MKSEINNIDNVQESKYEDMDRDYYNCIKNCAADLQNLSLNFFPSINAYACIPKLNAINSITFHPCISTKDYFNNTYSFKPLFTHHFFSDSEQVIFHKVLFVKCLFFGMNLYWDVHYSS